MDAARLSTCRRLLRVPDSALIDRALNALIAELEAATEAEALEANPYEDDPNLAWEVSDGPPLPYDGAVPKRVLDRARARRRHR